VACDASGNTVVASGNSLHKITNAISIISSRTLSGNLISVDLDFAGHVAAINDAGTVFVVNTGLTSHTNVSTGLALSAMAINLTGDIYAVGGTGTTPTSTSTLSTTNINMSAVLAGATGTATFTITSSGTAPLDITDIVINTTDPAGVWNVTPDAPPTITLPASDIEIFTVTLNVPSTISTDVNYSATIEITSTDAINSPQTVTVSGIGHVPVSQACYSTSTINFGQINAGSSSNRTFTIRSCGDLTLEVQDINLSTSDPAGVWIISPIAPPTIYISPTNIRTFTVTFNVPASIVSDVSYGAQLFITTNDDVGSTINQIDLNGTGHVPVAELYINAQYFDIDYRDVELGFHFGRPLVIGNSGDLAAELQIAYTNPTDPDIAHFDLETDAGNFTIAPYSQRIFRQTFRPTSFGYKEIEIIATSTNDLDFSQNVILHGNGTTPIPIDAALIIDRSGSMSQTAGEMVKIDALSQSAILFTELLLLRSSLDYLGLTKYNHDNDNIMSLGPIGTVAPNAISFLSQTADPNGIKPQGTTGIGGAMRTASEQFLLSPDLDLHREMMVVLTDGKENEDPSIRNVLDGYTDGSDVYNGLFSEYPNLLTYSVGLGLPSNINQDRLQEITNRGEGGFYLVTGNLDGLNIFNLENFYFKIFADAIGHTMVVDPTYSIGFGEIFEETIGIISEDREAFFFFIGELPEELYVFELIDPLNQVITTNSTIGGMSVHIKRMNNWSIFKINFPPVDVSQNYVGDWKLRVRLDAPKLDSLLTYHTTIKTTSTFNQTLATGRYRLSFAASVGSNYKLDANLAPGIVQVGEPIYVQANLTEGGWPAPKAQVHISVIRPDGTTEEHQLFDDGAHYDGSTGDAIFGGVYTNTIPGGIYRFDFRSVGQTERGESAIRVASRSQFVGNPSEDIDKETCMPCWLIRLYWILLLLFLIMVIIILWYCCFRRKLIATKTN